MIRIHNTTRDTFEFIYDGSPEQVTHLLRKTRIKKNINKKFVVPSIRSKTLQIKFPFHPTPAQCALHYELPSDLVPWRSLTPANLAPFIRYAKLKRLFGRNLTQAACRCFIDPNTIQYSWQFVYKPDTSWSLIGIFVSHGLDWCVIGENVCSIRKLVKNGNL